MRPDSYLWKLLNKKPLGKDRPGSRRRQSGNLNPSNNIEKLEDRLMLTAGNGLLGQYFANTDLSGPVVAQVDSTVDFNWGTGAPGATVGNDNLSVRWSGQVESQFTETYSFIVNADDGARLWVNGQLLIDEFNAGSGSDLTGTIDLIAGRRYDIQLEYLETTGSAAVSLEWSSSSLTRETVPSERLYASQRGSILAERWNGVSGSQVSNLINDADFPLAPDVVTSLSSFESTSNLGSNFGQRISGLLSPTQTGPYTFYISATQTAELYLSNTSNPADKQLIASVATATQPQQWDASPTQRSEAIYLAAGQQYYIEALHKDSVGADHLAVGWNQLGSFDIEVISGDYLSPVVPEVLLYADVTNVTEGSGSASYAVVRNGGPLNLPLTVNYTVSGSATNGVDYQSLSGSITIPAGAQSVDLLVTPLADTLAEGDESFEIELLAGDGYEVGFRSERTSIGTIQDDVDAPAGGTDLWSSSSLSDFSAFGGSYTTQTDPVFGDVIQAAISGTTTPFSAQIRQAIESGVNEGDILYAEFRARAVGTPGQVTAIFEKAGTPYTKSLSQGIPIPTQWTRIQIPFVAAETYAAGGATFGFHLGHGSQTIQFTDFELISYGASELIAPENSFFLNNLNGTWGSAQTVPVTGQSFDTAFAVNTTSVPQFSYEIQAVELSDSLVSAGDTMRFEFSLRATSGSSPEATFVLQDTSSFSVIFSENIDLTSEWQSFTFDVPATSNFGAGDLQAVFNLGHGIQTAEIGGFRWSNLSSGNTSLDIDSLPSQFPAPTYGGRSGTDAWRSQADVDIENERKSDVDVSVVDANGQLLEGAVVTLRQTDHAFRFGTAISSVNGQLSSTTDPNALTYQSEINRLFNTVVNENSNKWVEHDPNNLQGVQDVAFAQLNDLYIRGHNIIWPSREFMPDSVWNEYDQRLASDGATAAADWLRTTIENRFDQVLSTFDGDITEWDVVNEPFTNHDVMDILGDQIIVDWYQRVRDFDPNLILALNDFEIFAANGNNTAHRDSFDYWAGLLDDAGLLDVIGEQSHFQDSNLTDIPIVEDLIETYSTQFDATIAITEFDVNTKDEQLQADYLRDYLTLAFSEPAVEQFIQWGFWESSHFTPDGALYRADFSIKPNGQAYEDLVFGRWWSDVQGTTRDGVVSASVFEGEYDVIVEYEGNVYTSTVTVDDSGANSLTISAGSSSDQSNFDPMIDVATANVTGSVNSQLTNTGRWIEPDQQAVTLTASIGNVVQNSDGTWDWSFTPTQSFASQLVTITATDPNGSSDVSSFSIDATGMPAEVTGVVVNDGSVQRSRVDSLTVTISGAVTLDPGAISVIQRSDAGGVTGTSVGTTYTTAVVGGNTEITISFTSETRNSFGALNDGNYQLTIDHTKVNTGSSPAMAQDYVFGDAESDGFYSYFGDMSGDGVVGSNDLLSFRQTYRRSSGVVGYNSALDYDGDGVVGSADLLAFRQHYRRTLTWV